MKIRVPEKLLNKHGREAPSPSTSLAVKRADAYFRAGFAIIPLQPRGKAPLNPGGCNQPILRWSEFLAYVRRHPGLNFGIVTGVASGIVVIDVDGSEGEAHLRELEVEHGALPRTVVVLTAKGRHLFFGSDNRKLRCRTGWGPKLDLRANGGYVVGPGSVHANGKEYRYADGRSFSSVDIAPLPEWLEEVLLGKEATLSSPPQVSRGAFVEGQRNAELTSLAGQLHNTGIGGEALLSALLAENKSKCVPPLPDGEVRAIAESISRYAAHESSTDQAERVMECVLSDHFAGGAHLLKCADGRFWSFDKTHWQVLNADQRNSKILSTIRAMPDRKGANTSTLISQVSTLLSARCAEQGDPLRFRSEPPLVLNCRNCEVWLDAKGNIEQRTHSASSYLRHCFDVDYDPQAECGRYDQAILEIFANSEDPPQLALLWDEILGYTMQPRRPRPYIIIGRGSGSNGKTGLIQLFLKLIGPDAMKALPIEDLEKNRFTIGGLDGKLLLLDDDVKAGTRLPDGPLKKVSEAKVITGEHKFGPAFNFTVRALPMMFTNNQLSIADLSHGLRRRILVVPFARKFSDEEADVGLFDAIAANEREGVFNRYLAGLQRVVAAKWSFNVPAAVTSATADFLREANPLPTFIEERCETEGSDWVADLFSEYTSWCESSGITYRQQRMQFGRNLENLGYEVYHGNKGDRVRGLRIRVRP